MVWVLEKAKKGKETVDATFAEDGQVKVEKCDRDPHVRRAHSSS